MLAFSGSISGCGKPCFGVILSEARRAESKDPYLNDFTYGVVCAARHTTCLAQVGGTSFPMRFEARELKEYAEPVKADDLRVGEVYFSLQFEDEDLRIPILLPFMFIGQDLEQGDAELLYFQDYASFASGMTYESAAGDQAEFHVYGKNDLNHIFEYERALDGLLRCSLHRGSGRG